MIEPDYQAVQTVLDDISIQDHDSRIRQRYKKEVISLAILTDSHKGYQENRYHSELFGCELTFS